MKSTAEHKRFWKNRKINWQTSYLDTWDHPHRQLLVQILGSFNWVSLWELGCGPGANLMAIIKSLPNKQVGGSDINPEAIALAEKTFNGARFHVESADDILLSDKSVDVVLTDACLIYFGPEKIRKVLNEIRRCVRLRLIMCEFHSINWFERLWLRWKTGYNAYDYKKLLEEFNFHDVQMYKITDEVWPGFPWNKFGYIISARV